MFAEEKERPTQLLGTDGQDLFLHTDDEDDVAPADAIPLQPIRKKPSDVILRDGKKSQRRRATRTGIHLVYNGIFVVLMNLIWLNIAAVVKWLIPFGSILFEFVNLIASVINLINKEKPWYLIGAVILGALASMVIMGLIDAFRFGSTSAFVAGAFAAGPAVFTAVLGLFALLNFVKLGFTIKDCIKNPASRTPLKALSIVSQSVKVAGLIALAGLMIPFFAAIGAVMAGANPYSLIVLAVGVSTAIVVLTTVKLVKTLVENIVWKKTIAELKKKNLDPYELLGITNAKLLTLEEKITSEASKVKK
jgi:membrane protein YdbS with pleckstrin-like domain